MRTTAIGLTTRSVSEAAHHTRRVSKCSHRHAYRIFDHDCALYHRAGVDRDHAERVSDFLGAIFATPTLTRHRDMKCLP